MSGPALFDPETRQSPLIESWGLDGSVAAYEFARAHVRELVEALGVAKLADMVRNRFPGNLAMPESVEIDLDWQSSQKPTHFKQALAAHDSNGKPGIIIGNEGYEGQAPCGYKLFENRYGHFRHCAWPPRPSEPTYGERRHNHVSAIIWVILGTNDRGGVGYGAEERRFPARRRLPEPVRESLDEHGWTEVARQLDLPQTHEYRVGDVGGLHPDEIHAITARRARYTGVRSLVLELPPTRSESVVFDERHISLGGLTIWRRPNLVAAEVIPTRHQQRVYGVYPSEVTPEEMLLRSVHRLEG